MTEPMTGMLMQLPDHVNSVHCEWNLVTTPPSRACQQRPQLRLGHAVEVQILHPEALPDVAAKELCHII